MPSAGAAKSKGVPKSAKGASAAKISGSKKPKAKKLKPSIKLTESEYATLAHQLFCACVSNRTKTVGGGEDWVAMSMGFSQAGATGGGSGSAFGGGH